MSATSERVQRFYEAMATEREASLAHLEDYFTDDIAFADPFRSTQGMAAFRELFVRMFKQYKRVDFTDFEHDGTDDAFTVRMHMKLQMVVGPLFVIPMASVMRARGGKVYEMRDYFDISTSLVSPLPWLRRLYLAAMQKLFL